MKVVMKRQVTGTRNGKHWPKPGQTVDVSDREAETLIRQGNAEPVEEPAPKKTTKKAAGSY